MPRTQISDGVPAVKPQPHAFNPQRFQLALAAQQQAIAVAAPAVPAAKPKKVKGPSAAVEVATHALNGSWGDLSADDDGEVWRWDGALWSSVQRRDGVAQTSAWLYSARPDEATHSKACDAWDFACDVVAQKSARKPAPCATRVILPTRGAYLDVQTDGRIVAIAPDRALGLTHSIAAPCPVAIGTEHTPSEPPVASLFGRFLTRCLPDPAVRALVQEQCALTFTGPAARVAAWWCGSGQNGKDTLARIVTAFHARVAALDMHRLGDRFHIAPAIGASLIVVSEVSEASAWAEEAFKTLSAGEPISIEKKGRDATTARMRAKWLITAQQPPFYRDKTDGVRLRIIPVRWTETISEAERVAEFDRIVIEQEAAIVLDWILIGLRRIVARGGKMPPRAEWPEAVRALWEGTRENNDPLRAWLNSERVIYDSAARAVPKSSVVNAWAHWCRGAGLLDAQHRPPLDGPAFWAALRKMPEMSALATAPAKVIGRGADRVQAVQLVIQGPSASAMDPLDPITP